MNPEPQMTRCPMCGGKGYWRFLDEPLSFDCEPCGRTGKVTVEKEEQMYRDAERLKERMLETVRNWERRN